MHCLIVLLTKGWENGFVFGVERAFLINSLRSSKVLHSE